MREALTEALDHQGELGVGEREAHAMMASSAEAQRRTREAPRRVPIVRAFVDERVAVSASEHELHRRAFGYGRIREHELLTSHAQRRMEGRIPADGLRDHGARELGVP